MSQTPSTTNHLLLQIRKGKDLNRKEQFSLVMRLAIPAMIAGLANVMMNYVDAAMVGQLGANASASIALMSPSVWLFSGLCMCIANGFGVQLSHLIGANDIEGARNVVRRSFIPILIVGLLLMASGLWLAPHLPQWLRGAPELWYDSSSYFMIFSLVLPLVQLNWLCTIMLRCSGDIKNPSMANALMCIFDVIFNFFLIYPTRTIELFGHSFVAPGAGMGVRGAALGTALASLVAAVILLRRLLFQSPELKVVGTGPLTWSSFTPSAKIDRYAFHIGMPMSLQHFGICLAQIGTIVIVAPLGSCAVAAHGFGITAESFCYLPGIAISNAVTTLVGQSIGAGRKLLARSFAYIATFSGMILMGILGLVAMYFGGEWVLSTFTPVDEIVQMGVPCMQVEAFAEPMFAAAIIAYGACVGASDTVKPALMNLFSMWCVRITLAVLLTPYMGLMGIWLAMAIELCFRGFIFLCRIGSKKWLQHL